MSTSGTTALGLSAAAAWGAGDFTGGVASRRAHVFAVLVAAHASGIVLLSALALLVSEPAPARAALGWAALAGIAGAVGLTALWRAFAVGKMGIAAPVAAVLTAVLPVLVGIASAGLPLPRQLAGFACAAAGIWLVARSGGNPAGGAGQRGFPRELPFALLSGVGFSAYLVLTQRAGTGTVLWPLAAARCSSMLCGLLGCLAARTRPLPRDRRSLALALLSGLLDSSGNALFVLATRAGRLDVASVLASLYPVSTVVLARLVLRERLSRTQLAGMAATLAAIPLIAG
jgi:drug/metabolite transporter (DMT)-like permease